MKHTLSPRQVEIMRRICRGMIAKEISAELGIGVQTIEGHIKIAKKRLQARNIVQAAVKFTLTSHP
jgi:DNA-binding CsgD family transcriptional regulator